MFPAERYAPDEARRLLCLHALDILDTPSEGCFDVITHDLAQEIEASVVMLSFVDVHRCWVKSVSTTLERIPQEVPRRTCLSAFTILHSQKFLLLPDLQQDPLWRQARFVTGAPFFRAFLGSSIEGLRKLRIGALSIFDTNPRSFSPLEVKAIAQAALKIEQELAQRYKRKGLF